MGFKVLITLIVANCFACLASASDSPPFYLGGDISALSDLEKAGAVYRDNEKPADAIAILRRHGCNLFRLRLFVDPQPDGKKNSGATQDLPMILALAKRVKNCGAMLSLALHYSDTWADPGKQFKPARWADLPFDALEKKVAEYTVDVLKAMRANGTPPDLVEVGNETTNGMLWPDGKLGGATEDQKKKQWDAYARLVAAGVAGVRLQLPGARVLIHIDSGGRAGVPAWFFSELNKRNVDYDILGLSFYPTWKDSIDGLKENLRQLTRFDKDILIIETAYPYRTVQKTPQMQWPLTPAGQKQFLDEVVSTMKTVPDHRGRGVVWWYPEAIPLPGRRIWQNGSLGLFDSTGNLLPAMHPGSD